MHSSCYKEDRYCIVMPMAHSTVTDKFQTTIPLAVRRALHLKPRQKLSYEIQQDGSAVIRPEPQLDELFGSLKLKRPSGSTRQEKEAARDAMARETAKEGLK